jgi:hypothetical protein
MALSSYEDLAGYILRRLGSPVIKNEVEDQQLRDRIDDAILYFVERHHDGVTEKIFRVDFTDADEATQSFPLPQDVVHINKIFNLSEGETSSSEEFERLNYLISQSEFFRISTNNGQSHDLKNYHVTMEYLSLLQRYFNRPINYQVDKINGLVKVPSHQILATNFIIMTCLVSRTPENSPNLFNEKWIKDYATQLVKRQWGENLKKYEGVQMAGGVTVQGQKIWEEAQAEIDKLEESFTLKYQLPYGIFRG